MDVAELLTDGYNRVQEVVHATVDGLSPAQLAVRPDAEANSIAWLVWHLARVGDDHFSDAFGSEQLWLSAGWAERFGLSLPPDSTGYAHTSEQVAAVTVDDGALLVDYFDAVHTRNVELLATLAPADLDRVVDTTWDPPVTLGVRLVSVLVDTSQHVGQAAYVRGLVERSGL